MEFVQNLNQIIDQYNKHKIANLAKISRSNLYKIIRKKNTTLITVKKIAENLDLIPIVFYKNNEIIGEDFIEYSDYIQEVLHNYRLANGITLVQLEKKINISKSVISNIERGYSTSTKNIEIICKEYEIEPRYLQPKQ